MTGIYKITNPNDKIYIGQSVNIKQRVSKYQSLRCKSQRILYASILKYGWDNHKVEILCECEISELNEKERYYQDLYEVIGNKGLNCMLTTTTTKSGKASKETIALITGRKASEETREKMRNKVYTDKHKANISNGMKGRIVSEETRLKISASNKGKVRSAEYIVEMKKRIISDETKIKNSLSNKGKKRSQEIKDKLSALKKGTKPSEKCLKKMIEKNSKKIIDKSTGIIYKSITEVSRISYIKRTTLNSKLSGQNKNNTCYEYYIE